MKLFVALALAIVQVQAQTPFTYPEGSTACYPPGTGLFYNAGTLVKYVGGATVIFPIPTSVTFPDDSEFYGISGPGTVQAGTNVTFAASTQITLPPGTNVIYQQSGAFRPEVRYQQFNGNSHSCVQYPVQTPASFYCSNCNLVLHSKDTNPLVYYNPGGTTKYGVSALPVEKEFKPQTRTYGYYGGGGGYSYCSGYSYSGYPRTTYYNYNTGYSSNCQQTGYGTYSYGGGGAAGGGGYSMAGGSCYGGGAYYGSGGGMGGGYYGKK